MKPIYKINLIEEYIEQNKDMFSKHKATIEKLAGNDGKDCIINFKRDDTIDGAMMFTYIAGVLTVSGDYGYCVFNLYNKNNHILAFQRFNLSYMLGKVVASEPMKGFNEDKFHDDFIEFVDTAEEEGYIDIAKSQSLKDNMPRPENSHEVYDYFKNFTEIEDVYEYGVYDFGMHLKARPYIWWYGFQTALKQLEDAGVFE